MTRFLCPVCGSNHRREEWTLNQLVPDGWTLPERNKVCLCLNCGLIYYDNDRTQADYDTYYRERYGWDGSQNPQWNEERLDKNVDLAMKYVTDRNALIVDFGGGKRGYITETLHDLGYTNVHNVEVGEPLPQGIDLLISTQVFEHLYDIGGIMDRLTAAMAPTGRFLIEVPDATMLAERWDMPILDYHQKHVNHFRPEVLDFLFGRYHYSKVYWVSEFVKYGSGYAYRAVYQSWYDTYYRSRMRVETSLALSEARLREIRQPVIVWGLGDRCLTLLKRVPELQVVHYIDMDPAYRGTTIGGKPVLNYVAGNDPIVVMGNFQRTGILNDISRRGLKNEVIVI